MEAASSNSNSKGFTFVELLLALALGALIAGVLAALVHGLISSGARQDQRMNGPFHTRAAIRIMARELACAFSPPVKNLPPLTLATSTEPGKPAVAISFYAPVPAPPPPLQNYELEHITYEVRTGADGQQQLNRISVACSGPGTNTPATNLMLEGRFTLAIEAVTNGTARTEWPPATAAEPELPAAVRLTLQAPGAAVVQTEALIQSGQVIVSPVERPPVETNRP